jgi:hypothetical protein
MAGEMQSSKVLPNLTIDSSIRVAVDNVLAKLKDSPDSDVQAFVGELSSKNYKIKDGSPEDRAMCVGSNNTNSHTMYIPEKLVGSYTGSDGRQHDATVERMLAHELAHALGYDRKESVMTSSVMPRLHELAMQDGESIRGAGVSMTPAQIAGSHSRFPAGVAHEAGAVAVENFIASHVFHDYNARLNVSDRNPNFSVEDLKSWGSSGYPMTGNCRGVPLGREVETSLNEHHEAAQSAADLALQKRPELLDDYVQAKQQLLTQVADRPEISQDMVLAQFNVQAAKNIEQGISPIASSSQKQAVIEAQLVA